ncbi:MAG TPA: peptidoglycan-binding domain-containing protein [Terriglobales bacterium]|nr:peptidoglycan-binding domain-containing protein [Terriglobales bacterium]
MAHHGQQKIDSERARQIQQALVREHYLGGEPSGKWDPATEEALRRYQADHGWQNKTVPDSRALITLGLGPSHDHLLNPESAMTTAPQAPRGNAPSAPPPGSTDPADPPTTGPKE